MNRSFKVRVLGQKPVKACYNCGKFIPAFSEVIDFPMGGQPRCVCKDCTDGDFRNGKAFKNKEVGKSDKYTSTDCHVVMFYTFDEALAIAARVQHGFSSKKLTSGCYRLKYHVKSCNKAGWLFNENGIIDGEDIGFLANGIPCKTSKEYHMAVNAQTWYDDKVRNGK